MHFAIRFVSSSPRARRGARNKGGRSKAGHMTIVLALYRKGKRVYRCAYEKVKGIGQRNFPYPMRKLLSPYIAKESGYTGVRTRK
jgi:hypothetical protein